MYASKHEAYLLVQDQEELVDLLCTHFVINVYYKEKPSFSEPRDNFGSPPRHMLSSYIIYLGFQGIRKVTFI